MDWGGTGEVKHNSRRYHALADEYPIFSERFDANVSQIFGRASRHLRQRFRDLDLQTAIEVDKKSNPTTYRQRFRQMFDDAVECQRICSLVIAARRENQSLFKDNDPGHERAVQWWVNKATVWKMRLEVLQALDQQDAESRVRLPKAHSTNP